VWTRGNNSLKEKTVPPTWRLEAEREQGTLVEKGRGKSGIVVKKQLEKTDRAPSVPEGRGGGSRPMGDGKIGLLRGPRGNQRLEDSREGNWGNKKRL